MIKKETITKTAVCYFSEEDDCYIVESPLLDRVIGTGDTRKEAFKVFHEMLDEFYPHVKAGNVAGLNKVGRPAKLGVVQLSCKPKEGSQTFINSLAKELDISQGEVIDLLCFFYEKRVDVPAARKPATPEFGGLVEQVRKEVRKEVRKIASAMEARDKATARSDGKTKRLSSPRVAASRKSAAKKTRRA